MNGGDGNDRVSGGGGDDKSHGGDGNDHLNLGTENDSGWGEAGSDYVQGLTATTGLSAARDLTTCPVPRARTRSTAMPVPTARRWPG